jgi:hypothetical protein
MESDRLTRKGRGRRRPFTRHTEALPPSERKVDDLYSRAYSGQPGAPDARSAVTVPGDASLVGRGGGGYLEVAMKRESIMHRAKV